MGAIVLNKFLKFVQPLAKVDTKEIWMAKRRDEAEIVFDRFLAKCQVKYDKVADCSAKDCDALRVSKGIPVERWTHIRTGNPIGSTFVTVRHRIKRYKGYLRCEIAKTMVFRPIQVTWSRRRFDS